MFLCIVLHKHRKTECELEWNIVQISDLFVGVLLTLNVNISLAQTKVVFFTFSVHLYFMIF